VVAKTTTYTFTVADFLVTCNATGGAFTTTLPAAASFPGQVFGLMKTDASGNACTLGKTGGDVIDGAATVALSAQYGRVYVTNDGVSNWWVIVQQ
jgi:hypothetical protein